VECRLLAGSFIFQIGNVPNAQAGMPPGKALRRAASQSRSIEDEPFTQLYGGMTATSFRPSARSPGDNPGFEER